MTAKAELTELLKRCLAHFQQPTLIPLPVAVATLVKQRSRPGRTWLIGLTTAFFLTVIVGIGISLTAPGSRRDDSKSNPTATEARAPVQTPDSNWIDGAGPESEQIDQKLRIWETESEF